MKLNFTLEFLYIFQHLINTPTFSLSLSFYHILLSIIIFFFFFYLSWRVNFFWVFKHFFSLFILFSSYLSFVFIILFIRFTIFFIFFFFLRIFSFHSNPPKMNWMFCILLNGKKIKSLVKCTVEVEKYGALTKTKPYLL